MNLNYVKTAEQQEAGVTELQTGSSNRFPFPTPNFLVVFFFFFLRGGQILVLIAITYLSSLHLVVYMNFKPT